MIKLTQEVVTQWFDWAEAPIHEGVYEVRAPMHHGCLGRTWALWKGGEWKCASWDREEAAETTWRSDSCYDGKYTGWRGLAEKPA